MSSLSSLIDKYKKKSYISASSSSPANIPPPKSAIHNHLHAIYTKRSVKCVVGQPTETLLTNGSDKSCDTNGSCSHGGCLCTSVNLDESLHCSACDHKHEPIGQDLTITKEISMDTSSITQPSPPPPSPLLPCLAMLFLIIDELPLEVRQHNSIHAYAVYIAVAVFIYE